MNYEESLMVKAAWYYYFENMTQQAIAERLSVSRMRVIRLLENARQNGIIQFRLRSDGVSVMEQSQKLMEKYPQVMINVRVSPEGKIAFYTDPAVRAATERAKAELGRDGRIVIRVSGTEPLVRVMVEGRDIEQVQRVAEEAAEAVRSSLS